MNKLIYVGKKTKIHALDVYVIFSISVLLIYTIVAQIIAVLYNVQVDTLTTCFFAAFGGEILSACLIKIFKLKKAEDSEDNKIESEETFG